MITGLWNIQEANGTETDLLLRILSYLKIKTKKQTKMTWNLNKKTTTTHDCLRLVITFDAVTQSPEWLKLKRLAIPMLLVNWHQ